MEITGYGVLVKFVTAAKVSSSTCVIEMSLVYSSTNGLRINC